MNKPKWTPSEGATFDQAIFEALGSASMCWEYVDRAGVFQSSEAKDIGDGLIEYLRTELDG